MPKCKCYDIHNNKYVEIWFDLINLSFDSRPAGWKWFINFSSKHLELDSQLPASTLKVFKMAISQTGRAYLHWFLFLKVERENWPMSWHHKLELGSVPKPFLRNPSVTEFVSKKTLRIGDPPPRLRTEVEKISAKITIFQLILIWLQTWTPGTRWRHLQKFKIGPPVLAYC